MQYDSTILGIIEELKGPDTDLMTKTFWYRVAHKLHPRDDLEQLGYCCYRRLAHSLHHAALHYICMQD